MIKRLNFMIHWITLLWVGGFTIGIGISIPEYGLPRPGQVLLWAMYLGPPAVFYLIDYIIYGKITWFPWDREK
jgi:hypothetical protein